MQSNTSLWILALSLGGLLTAATDPDLRERARAYRNTVRAEAREFHTVEREMRVALRASSEAQRNVRRDALQAETAAIREQRNAIRQQMREVSRDIHDAYRR